MDKGKINEVSNLLDIESSNVVDSKVIRVLKRMIFPLIQTGFFITSSLLGLAFGYWEKAVSSEYPYGVFGEITRAYFWGPIALTSIGAGNLTLTIITRKKLGIERLLGVIVVLLNLGLSFLSFFLIYHSILGDTQGTSMTIVPKYNVHEKK